MTGLNFLTAQTSPALQTFEKLTDMGARQARQQEEMRVQRQQRDIDAALGKIATDEIAANPGAPPTLERQTAGALAKAGAGKAAVETLMKSAKTESDRFIQVMEQFGTKGNRAVGDELARRYRIEVPPPVKQSALFADGLVNAAKISSDKGDPAWIAKYATAFAKNNGDPAAALAEAGEPRTKKDSQVYTVGGDLVGADGSVIYRGKEKPRAANSPLGRLKQDLADGTITQEEFDAEVKNRGGGNRTSAPRTIKTQDATGRWVYAKVYRDGREEITDMAAPPPGNTVDATRAKDEAIRARKATEATRKHFASMGRDVEKVTDEEWDKVYKVQLAREQGKPAGVKAPEPEPKGPGIAERIGRFFGGDDKPAPAAEASARPPPVPKADPGFTFPRDKPLVPTTQADVDAAPSGSYIMDPATKKLFRKP